MASWQVDIPGLSNLVMSAGAHGLKQLALSGVDIHTIGCMLMVSELIPASQDFRQIMNFRREKQRTERQWLYKLVELGAGSTFLVDHFLKTRAGENVLALLASIVPLMSQDACSAVLGSLFENKGVPLDHTPGVNQFFKLREATMAFARSVGFQEKVLQYHVFLERLTSGSSSKADAAEGRDPFDAIPREHDISRIIELCHRVATSPDSCVLVFKGFEGSGWVAAYASFILGLPVCAVDNAGMQVPITNNYKKAKIILEPSAQSASCEILTAGKLSDFISVEALAEPSRRGWSVNCQEVNFVSLNLHDVKDSVLLDVISDFAAFATLNEVVRLTTRLSEATFPNKFGLDKPEFGVDRYLVSILPFAQQRSLEILTLLGFRVKDWQHYQAHADAGSYAMHRVNDVDSYSLADYMSHKVHNLPNGFRKAILGYSESWSNEITTWNTILSRFIRFASQLSFTDWNKSSMTMSARYARGAPPIISRNRSLRDPIGGLLWGLLACTDIGDDVTLDRELDASNWLCVHLDGVVLLRNAATCQSIHKLEGRLFAFSPGHLIFEGRRIERVLMDSKYRPNEVAIASPSESLTPENVMPSLKSRFLFSGSKDTLWVRHEILNGDDLLIVADPIAISDTIPKLCVTTACGHPYATVYKPPSCTIIKSSRTPQKTLGPLALFPGFHFTGIATQEADDGIVVHYQQVDRNDLGQWLACQWTNVRGPSVFRILQTNACLTCIVARILDGVKKLWEQRGPRPETIAIIAGGQEDPH